MLGTAATVAQVNTLATTLSSYITAATQDGTLATAQTSLLKYITGPVKNGTLSGNLASASYSSLKASGWNGTESQISTWMSTLTSTQYSEMTAYVQSSGLASFLTEGVTALQQLASEIASSPRHHGTFSYASYNYMGAQLLPVLTHDQCNVLTGSFLAILAIGAAAALGGLDPLGDLLGAIGAFGLLYLWLACP
ncbi:MAG: hypothetical protein WB919_00995 [Candidatus Sulfotelmatobacter sp.]